MLSFGIRFGQGFDRQSVLKLMPSIPTSHDYDLLVVGTNPGGVALAREAGLAGKKVAIIKWKTFTPAEEEGFDEDLEDMAEALEVSLLSGDAIENQTTTSTDNPDAFQINKKQKKGSAPKSVKSKSTSKSRIVSQVSEKSLEWSRKVRRSRLDLNNVFYRRGQQVRKVMHNAANLQESVENARNCGWRITSVIPPITFNWTKLTERVLDYVMEENWKLEKELGELGIEMFEGIPTFHNEHNVIVESENLSEREMSADMICTAPEARLKLPEEIPGALEFGINCDDFVRMSEPPGKTLVVGSLPEGLECAGILACCQFPVFVVSRSKILNGFDSEMSKLVVDNLKSKGVVFWEGVELKSIKLAKKIKLLATFESIETNNDSEGEKPEEEQEKEKDAEEEKEEGEKEIIREEEFDTVLFAVGTELSFDFFNLSNAGIHVNSEDNLVLTNEKEETSVPHIYAIGNIVSGRPQSFEITEWAGMLLGKRLFHNKTELMEYSMFPTVIYTPTEYAFVGISEDAALFRLGPECVDIYHGYFTPLDFFLSPKKEQCFAKIIVLKSTERVIGFHIFGLEAGEVIQGFTAALKVGLTMSQLRTVVGANSTKAQEVLKLKELRKTSKEETDNMEK